MIDLWRLAWRNVGRNPFRSGLLGASVAIGLWAGLFVMAFAWGAVEQKLRSGIRALGHGQVHAPGFRSEYRAAAVILGGDSLASALAGASGVRAVSARFIAQGMVSDARGAAAISLLGVDSEAENALTGIGPQLVEGEYFPEATRRPILIGKKLADKRGLKLRSKVVATFQDSDGQLASAAFRVTGIFRTSDARHDENKAYVPDTLLDGLLGTGGVPHEIAFSLESGDSVEAFIAAWRKRAPEAEILSWRELSPELDLTVSSTAASLLVFMAIILLGLACGIMNTMLMAVLERAREIGMLMALGMRRRKVFALILFETCLIVLGSTPLGLGLAILTVAVLGRVGIDLSAVSEGLSAFGMDSLVYPSLKPEFYGQVLGLVVATAFLSSLLPARQALKLKPVDALRSG